MLCGFYSIKNMQKRKIPSEQYLIPLPLSLPHPLPLFTHTELGSCGNILKSSSPPHSHCHFNDNDLMI